MLSFHSVAKAAQLGGNHAGQPAHQRQGRPLCNSDGLAGQSPNSAPSGDESDGPPSRAAASSGHAPPRPQSRTLTPSARSRSCAPHRERQRGRAAVHKRIK